MSDRLFTKEQAMEIAKSVAEKVCGNDLNQEYIEDLFEQYDCSGIKEVDNLGMISELENATSKYYIACEFDDRWVKIHIEASEESFEDLF